MTTVEERVERQVDPGSEQLVPPPEAVVSGGAEPVKPLKQKPQVPGMDLQIQCLPCMALVQSFLPMAPFLPLDMVLCHRILETHD